MALHSALSAQAMRFMCACNMASITCALDVYTLVMPVTAGLGASGGAIEAGAQFQFPANIRLASVYIAGDPSSGDSCISPEESFVDSFYVKAHARVQGWQADNNLAKVESLFCYTLTMFYHGKLMVLKQNYPTSDAS